MSEFDKVTTAVLLGISLAVWLVLLGIYVVRRIIDHTEKGPCKKMGISKTLLFSGCLLLSVWCLRYAVGYYSILFPKEDEITLRWWEEVLNSLVHALQTFSMDENYALYIARGKEMMAAFGADAFWQDAYGAYASVLNVLAPIAGGAIVLEVLARIFPELHLWLTHFVFWRKKYYFSELNAASLALAKSISREKRSEHPMLIFTDTYVDDEKEQEYELFVDAKRYGAICVRKDLAHVGKPWFGKREFYLMDEDEFSNLQTLMGLLENRNIRRIKDSCIYLFVQSDAYLNIEKQAKRQLEEKKHLLRGGSKPVIVPVHGYRNLVQNLFNTVPLYEPLVNKEDKAHLNVTILGSGVIGKEAFLGIYWLGQMMVSQGEGEKATMEQVELTVNVVSNETEEAFWAEIDYVNPEIRQTVEVLKDTAATEAEQECQKSLLRIYPNREETNKPYCRVRYTRLDVKAGSFWTNAQAGMAQLPDSDYYIVALGDDADNISTAEKIRSFIGKRHVEKIGQNKSGEVVIAYAVFDAELCEALNRDKHFKSLGKGTADIYMHAFGNLEQVYSCDNVYMSKNLLWATETGAAYLRGQYENSHRQDNMNRVGDSIQNYEDANYNYWASLARAMHMKYKLFSLGWITTSVFRCENEEECASHRQTVRDICALYQLFAAAGKADLLLSADSHKKWEDLKRKQDCLAWLEHRRWNAFTRTMGYQYVDVHRMLEASETGLEHKDMRLKLHACLAETRMPDMQGVRSYLTGDGEGADMLDMMVAAKRVVIEARREELRAAGIPEDDLPKPQKDLKVYDYYVCEFDNFQPEEKLREELKQAGIRRPGKYCSHKKFRDSIVCKVAEGELHLVAVEAVKWTLSKDYRAVAAGECYKGSFIFRKTCYAPKWSVWWGLRDKKAEEIKK